MWKVKKERETNRERGRGRKIEKDGERERDRKREREGEYSYLILPEIALNWLNLVLSCIFFYGHFTRFSSFPLISAEVYKCQ